MRITFCLFLSILIASCRNEYSNIPQKQNIKTDCYCKANKYAKGFKICYTKDSLIELHIYLLPDTSNAIAIYKIGSNDGLIKIPFNSFAVNSTTWLAFFKLLGKENLLTGFSGLQHISDSVYTHRIKLNKLMEISNGRDIDVEKLIMLSPQALITYPFEGDKLPDVEKYGIKHFYNSDYLENTPLGKTEWIKFFGLLTGEEKKADSIFELISNEYNTLKKRVNKKHKSPSVFTNKPYKGVWYIQGGNSYAANFIKDAGGTYIFSDSNINNVYPMDFEYVFNKALNAEIWLIISHEKKNYTLKDLLAEDHRYKHFKAVKNKKVIICNTSLNPYFEKSPVEPNIVLKDLIKLFHPELMKNHTNVYFKLLE